MFRDFSLSEHLQLRPVLVGLVRFPQLPGRLQLGSHCTRSNCGHRHHRTSNSSSCGHRQLPKLYLEDQPIPTLSPQVHDGSAQHRSLLQHEVVLTRTRCGLRANYLQQSQLVLLSKLRRELCGANCSGP